MSSMERPSPEPILKHGRAIWESCALIAGIRLNVFEALRAGPLSAVRLARKLRCRLRGIHALADALASHGYLEYGGGRYRLPPLSRVYLLPGGETYMGDILRHLGDLLEGWSRLDESVRTGRPVARRRRTPQEAAAFTRAMASLARITAPLLARMLRLDGTLFLLDIGGGPGLHSLHFCRRNPRMHAIIMDSPDTLEETRRILRHQPEITRIRFQPGDALKDPLPNRMDVVWMSHLIHCMGESDVRRLLRKARGALLPGGRLIIHEFFTHEGRPGPPYPSLFRLNMLRGTTAGRTYSREELKRWMARLGFRRVKSMDLPPPGTSGILIARLPARTGRSR